MRAPITIKENPGIVTLPGPEELSSWLALMTYNTSTAPRKPSAEVIPFSTTDAREYWRHQSIRDHTDWCSLGLAAARVLWQLQLTSAACWRSS